MPHALVLHDVRKQQVLSGHKDSLLSKVKTALLVRSIKSGTKATTQQTERTVTKEYNSSLSQVTNLSLSRKSMQRLNPS
jgi:hypothetical protein